jgi:prepilin-type processing-associated H-X9-DG protein
MLRDGTSSTYLLGEKYINAEHYATGRTPGDDQTMYLGDDADIRRWTVEPPLPDSRRVDSKEHFGSAHSSGCHFAFCDGSVRLISYQVDSSIHRRLGNRRDRIPVNLDMLE